MASSVDVVIRAQFEDIVEVGEVGRYACNDLLAAGYRLLAVEAVASGVERENKGGEKAATFWVRKGLIYAVGRPAGPAGPDGEFLPPIGEFLRAAAEKRREARNAAAEGEAPSVRDEG